MVRTVIETIVGLLGLFVIACLVILVLVALSGVCYIGLSRVLDGVRGLRSTTHIVTTDPIDPSEVPESGYATIVGRAIDGPDGVMATPFTGQDAVGYRYRIKQQTDGVGWWTVTEGGRIGEFVLEGPTGRVLVDGAGATPGGIDRRQVAEHSGTESMADARSRIERAFDDDLIPHVTGETVSDPRRYEEGTLDPGQELYVYGACTDDPNYDGRIDASESSTFVVDADPPSDGLDDHDESWSDHVKRILNGLFITLIGGLFLIVVGSGFVDGIRSVLGV